MPYVNQTMSGKNKGKWKIDTKETFSGVLNGVPPPSNTVISQELKRFDAAVNAIHAVHPGALNNAHGTWYEWFMSITALNVHQKHSTPFVALRLSNATNFRCHEMYVPAIASKVTQLEESVQTIGVNLVSSNPDYVIVRMPSTIPIPSLTNITPQTLSQIDLLHRQLRNMCSLEDIRGYMSVKNSFRPDRRLQIPHEGSLRKALHAHLRDALSQWHSEIVYYALAANVKASDRKALRTVATHSIVQTTKPQSAVDEVFEVDTIADAEAVFLKILK